MVEVRRCPTRGVRAILRFLVFCDACLARAGHRMGYISETAGDTAKRVSRLKADGHRNILRCGRFVGALLVEIEAF